MQKTIPTNGDSPIHSMLSPQTPSQMNQKELFDELKAETEADIADFQESTDALAEVMRKQGKAEQLGAQADRIIQEEQKVEALRQNINRMPETE